MAVAGGETADDARAADGGVHDGDDVAELRLEGGVEVGAALDGDEAVRVCEFGEDADVAAVFELETCPVSLSKESAAFIANVRVAILTRTSERFWRGRQVIESTSTS